MANSRRAGRRVGAMVHIQRGGDVVGRYAMLGMRAAKLFAELKIPFCLFGRYGVSYERASVIARRRRGLLRVSSSPPSREGKQRNGNQCDPETFVLPHTTPPYAG